MAEEERKKIFKKSTATLLLTFVVTRIFSLFLEEASIFPILWLLQCHPQCSTSNDEALRPTLKQGPRGLCVEQGSGSRSLRKGWGVSHQFSSSHLKIFLFCPGALAIQAAILWLSLLTWKRCHRLRLIWNVGCRKNPALNAGFVRILILKEMDAVVFSVA